MLTEEKMKCFVDEWIEVVSHGKSKKYYEFLGYKKYRNKEGKLVFKVHPWNLRSSSTIKIKIKCSNCSKIRLLQFKDFYKAKTTLCNYCSNSQMGKNTKNNLIGQRFGKLIIIKDTGKRDKNRVVIWLCKCDCGNYCKVRSTDLTRKKIKSCGCLQKEVGRKNLLNFHKKSNHFIYKEHNQKEIDNHLKNIKYRGNDFKWNELSKKLRKSAKCIICDSKENLLVHHLNGYWEFPEQRYNEDNLVVMCNSCHSKYHSKYKSTKEDWEKFMKDNTIFKCTYAKGKTIELTEQEALILFNWLEQKLTGFRRTNFVEQNNPEIRKK